MLVSGSVTAIVMGIVSLLVGGSVTVIVMGKV